MKNVLKNHLFLWHLCFKTCPGYMLYFLYDGFRYQGVIFIEHVLGINYVLKCAEFHEPFKKAFIYIGIILLVNILQIIPDGFFIHGWSFRAKPKIYKALKEKMYAKAAEIDLNCYDDPKYYNDFVLAVSESESSIDRFLALCNSLVQGLTIIFTTGVFYLVTDKTGILFVFVSFVLRFFVSKALNKINVDTRIRINPKERKRNYVSRLFYLKDYAKELRLHPEVGKRLSEEFAEADDEIIDIQRKVGNKLSFLEFVRQYVVDTFLLDGLYITYLVYSAAVLHTICYSDAVTLFNRTGSLRRGMATFADLIPSMHENSLYVDKIRTFLDYEVKIKPDEGKDVSKGPGEIVIDNLSFSYKEGGAKVLDNISLRVKPCERVAIVGYNGAGKTTLIKLLMRLYDPTEGSIYYHGENIKEYKPRDYRHKIGVVFQDFQLYGARLSENVVMGNIEDSEYEGLKEPITKALIDAGFEKRLNKLENGLDTMVTTEFDEAGVDFSGGESQKIAISRAFYKDADILIMDEPSSALDPIAEYELNKAMESATEGKTVFYISHRLSTTRDADRIIMLENGRIIEEGTHDSLIKLNGKYAAMWNAQAGKYAIS